MSDAAREALSSFLTQAREIADGALAAYDPASPDPEFWWQFGTPPLGAADRLRRQAERVLVAFSEADAWLKVGLTALELSRRLEEAAYRVGILAIEPFPGQEG